MTHPRPRHYSAFAGMLALAAVQAQAAGFSLIEQSVSGLGNAYAGAGARAEDASTVFYNPAGLMYLSGGQLVVAGHLIRPSIRFSGSASDPLGGPIAGGDGGDAGDLALVPNLYYSRELANGFRFGLGINAPFGLKTEYAADWVGRYQAIESEVKTVNINPAIAYNAGPNLSVGVGLNVQYIEATLTQAVDQRLACLNAGGGGACAGLSGDLTAAVEGDDWGLGYNFGLMYDLGPGTRLGLAYRSKVKQTLEGDAGFSGAHPFFTSTVGVFVPTAVRAEITLPESVSLNLYHELNGRWALLADASWTRWSRFQALAVDFANPLQPDSTTPEDWTNSLRYALGVNYRHNGSWLLRAGIAYDKEPIRDAQRRTPRIPGNDRTWLAVGANYRLSPKLSLDIGYAHLFVDDTRIEHTDASGYTLSGTYDSDVDILSTQMNWTF
ncbi:MAG: OmpP1/FadL family transporter [Gammaproteobacteria bacterium]